MDIGGGVREPSPRNERRDAQVRRAEHPDVDEQRRTDVYGVVRVYHDGRLVEKIVPNGIVSTYRGGVGDERVVWEQFPDGSYRVY